MWKKLALLIISIFIIYNSSEAVLYTFNTTQNGDCLNITVTVTGIEDATVNLTNSSGTVTVEGSGVVLKSSHTSHSGGSATCQAKAVCTTCGKSYGSKAACSYVATTCKWITKCKWCGVTKGAHSAEAKWYQTADETQHYKLCSGGCGTKMQQASHSVGTAATCTTSKKCAICSLYYGPTLGGHVEPRSYSTDTTRHWKKCTRSGCSYMYYNYEAHKGGTATCQAAKICEVCNASYGSKVSHSYTVATSCGYIKKCEWCTSTSGAHASSGTAYEGKDETHHWKKCTSCGVQMGSKIEHSGGTATCISKAICKICGGEYSSALGHLTPSEYKTDANQHWKECGRGCGTIVLAKANHIGGSATCQELAACTTCGIKYGGLAGHNYTVATDCAYITKCKWCEATSGQHVAAETWTNDETYHWKLCTSGCGTIIAGSKVEHSGGTHDNDGMCTICEYFYQLHDIGSEIVKKDETYHYYNCVIENCAGLFEMAHEFENTEGYHELKCGDELCGYTKTHTPVWEYATENSHDCTVELCEETEEHNYIYEEIEADYKYHRVECKDCTLVFSDEAAEEALKTHGDIDGDYVCDQCEMKLYELTYDPLPSAGSEFVNTDVVATLIAWNTDKVYTHTFIKNGEYTFKLENPEKEIVAKVDWINKSIFGTISYDETEEGIVKATLTVNENIELTNNGFMIQTKNEDGKNKYTYTFKENGKFTFKVEDKYGNIAEFTVYVTSLNDKNKIFTSMEYNVMEKGYIFANVNVDMKSYWKISDLFSNKFNITVDKIDISGTVSQIDTNNISCMVAGLYDEQDNIIDKNTTDFLRAGIYKIYIAIGGPNLFIDKNATYKVGLKDVSLKGAGDINMRLNSNKANYIYVKVKELRDLT